MSIGFELAEASSVLGTQSVHFADAIGAHAWGAVVAHRGRLITVRYAPDHPFAPPWVYIDPPPANRHYYRHGSEVYARLCWCRNDEWSPTYHLVVALGAAITFLNEEVQ